MLNTVLILAKKSLVRPSCYIICIAAFIPAMFTKFPTVCIILLAAVSGILIQKAGGKAE